MGPLAGLKVLEIAGLGAAPFCCLLLADMGADVLRIDRPPAGDSAGRARLSLMNRGRRSVALDLKKSEAVATVLRLAEDADVLIEGFRPGIMERLGLGPEECRQRNPRLVYARMTGWGQTGPLAQEAGHDINYIAVAGVLDAIGRRGERPMPPLNLVGDFGGGAMFLVFGVLCALWEARESGRGQVVDAAMIDGSARLMTMFHGMRASHRWRDDRGSNVLDTGAPFYDVYETADSRYVAVGAIEPKFYANLLKVMELDADHLPDQHDRDRWPEMKRLFADTFRRRTRDAWCKAAAGMDACLSPVVSMAEVADHPHHRARGGFLEVDGVVQPAPAPRFSRTRPGAPDLPPPWPGEHSREALARWGLNELEIEQLLHAGALHEAKPASGAHHAYEQQ